MYNYQSSCISFNMKHFDSYTERNVVLKFIINIRKITMFFSNAGTHLNYEKFYYNNGKSYTERSIQSYRPWVITE